MGRFHVCMPVAENNGFRCFVCHRDMRAEMSEYDSDVEQIVKPTKVPAGRKGDTDERKPGPRRVRGAREARRGLG